MEDYQSQYTGSQIDEALAAGLELRNNPQLALANLGGAPARNFADNAYFAGGGDPGNFPINQKGLKTYSISASGTKMVDRWLLNSGTVVIESNCIDLQGSGIIIQRYAEFDIRQGEYTFSWLDTDGNMYSTPVTGAYTVSGSLKVTHNNTNQLYVKFEQPSTKVVAFGLDVGTEQRQFYKGSDGKWKPIATPNYWETLTQCLRYYYDSGAFSNGEDGSIKSEVWGVGSSAIHYTEGQRFPALMRTTPAISFYSAGKRTPGKVSYGDSGYDALAIPQAMFVGRPGFAQINLTGEDPELTGNQAYYFYIANAEL